MANKTLKYKDAGPSNLPEMLASALDHVNSRYTLPEVAGYITAMNEESEDMVKKLLPDAAVEDHITGMCGNRV